MILLSFKRLLRTLYFIAYWEIYDKSAYLAKWNDAFLEFFSSIYSYTLLWEPLHIKKISKNVDLIFLISFPPLILVHLHSGPARQKLLGFWSYLIENILWNTFLTITYDIPYNEVW